MSIIAKDSKREYEPAPEGLHQAVCVDVVDLGIVDGNFGPRHKVRIYWQLEVKDETGKPFLVQKQYTLSLNEKANLRKDLETWRGAKFRPEELQGFDLEKLIGVNCQVQLIHNIRDESTYANVQAVIGAPKGVARLHPVDYVRRQDRDKQQGTGNGNGGEVEDEIVPF